MKLFLSLLLVLVAVIGSVTPHQAMAQPRQTAQGQQLPIIVIRFRDNSVDYQKSLFTAIRSALQAKPNMFFDVLTVIPILQYDMQQRKMEQTSAVYTQQIIGLMSEMGVTPQQMQIRSAFSDFVESPEVQIFVR